MNVVQDLQAILIDALLREVTASQAEAAVARLLHVMSGDALVMSDAEDEVAAA
jgi:cell division protein FtsI/penicillin-binding protein 2